MNKKLLTLFVVLIAGLSFLVATGVLIASDVPDEVMIETEGYKKDKKGPVKLTHKKHSEEHKVSCNDCHHEYKDGKNCWNEEDPVKKCAECHNPMKQKDEEVRNLKKAYHNNCQGCHKTLKEDGKIPEEEFNKLKKCTNCHQKKAK